ncbi:hypothetical protein ACF0H5_019104 [Mactra antiquata]
MDGQESYIKVDTGKGELKFQTIPEYLKFNSENNPDGEAFVFASVDEPWQRITWSELYSKACATAKGFVANGLKPKEIVAINLRVCPEWLYATYGAAMAGGIPCGISFTYMDGSDLVAMMERLKTCSFLVMDPGYDGVNWKIAKNQLDEFGLDGTAKSKSMPYLRRLIGVGKVDDKDWSTVKSLDDIMEQEMSVELPTIMSEDIIGLFQTSGSTGIPKLIPYTHNMVILMTSEEITELYEDKMFNDRPFNWVGGYAGQHIVTGCTRVTISGFGSKPVDHGAFVLDVIVSEKCTTLFALSPFAEELRKKQEQNLLPSDWPVTKIMTGGQPLTKRIAAVVGKVCKTLYCAYGLSECFAVSLARVNDADNFAEYGCGKMLSLPGIEVKIVDEAGNTVPINTRGELYLRSPIMFKGYFNDEERTRKVFTADRWYKSDDLGRMNRNGELFVEGRKSNMILSGGFNVAPEIMETAMKTFPGILQVVIVPIPDEVLYQVLCACVLTQPDVDVTEEQVRKQCEEFHADKRGLFTVLPKFFIFFNEFPMLRTGKVNRKELEKIANVKCLPESKD